MEATLRTPTVKDGGDAENTDGGTDDGSDSQVPLQAPKSSFYATDI